MNWTILIFIIVFTFIAGTFFWLKYASNQRIESELINYYKDLNLTIISIRKLSFLERFRYKVVFNGVFSFGNPGLFNIFEWKWNNKEDVFDGRYFRVIRSMDIQNKEWTKYIQLYFFDDMLDKVEELDSYEF